MSYHGTQKPANDACMSAPLTWFNFFGFRQFQQTTANLAAFFANVGFQLNCRLFAPLIGRQLNAKR